MTLVATQVKRRRGTTAENDAFTGVEGEITVDLTTHELRVHDGSTVGGHTIPTKKLCAHQVMPSHRRIELTLGASESTYTAPADGYFMLQGRPTGTGNLRMALYNTNSNVSSGFAIPSPPANTQYVFIPVSAGNSIQVIYNNFTVSAFIFVYANGAE